ncbi:protein Flattop [Sphaeramia orbicularis]|uniref:protein Flattop n=1 Tax=Sphaeramia orbicularis TaxID=375764 RepID=UPI00117D0AD9|nr:protein Flattop [Sphaeramia orbicularis]
MSSGYSANQYDSAFKSQRLQNWCVSKPFKERPTAHEGHTAFIANDRGHLLPGVVKKGSAWPDFKGTWDLPARIPAHRICPTARSVEGLNRLKSWGFDTGSSEPQRGSKNTDKDQDAGHQQDGAGQSSLTPPAIEVLPETQDRPPTGGQRNSTQDSKAVVHGSVSETAEGIKPAEATGEDRPLSQLSTAKEKPVSRPATREGTSSRSGTGKRRPMSNMSQKEVNP